MLRTYLIIAAIGYLCGSIPFGYILVRIFRGQDIRATGSGNIGATNVARTAPGLGIATLLLDAAKGLMAVEVAKTLVPGYQVWVTLNQSLPADAQSPFPAQWHVYLAVAAFSAVVGHMFPVWLRFRGGKGVATAVGAFAGIAPLALLVSFVGFAVSVAASRYVSLGSIIAAVTFPVAMRLLNPETPLAAVAIVGGTSLLIILKHHANIRRILSGTENRFVLKRKVAVAQAANED